MKKSRPKRIQQKLKTKINIIKNIGYFNPISDRRFQNNQKQQARSSMDQSLSKPIPMQQLPMYKKYEDIADLYKIKLQMHIAATKQYKQQLQQSIINTQGGGSYIRNTNTLNNYKKSNVQNEKISIQNLRLPKIIKDYHNKVGKNTEFKDFNLQIQQLQAYQYDHLNSQPQFLSMIDSQILRKTHLNMFAMPKQKNNQSLIDKGPEIHDQIQNMLTYEQTLRRYKQKISKQLSGLSLNILDYYNHRNLKNNKKQQKVNQDTLFMKERASRMLTQDQKQTSKFKLLTRQKLKTQQKQNKSVQNQKQNHIPQYFLQLVNQNKRREESENLSKNKDKHTQIQRKYKFVSTINQDKVNKIFSMKITQNRRSKMSGGEKKHDQSKYLLADISTIAASLPLIP